MTEQRLSGKSVLYLPELDVLILNVSIPSSPLPVYLANPFCEILGTFV